MIGRVPANPPRAADLLRSGHKHHERSAGPLPDAIARNTGTGPDLGFCVAGVGFEPTYEADGFTADPSPIGMAADLRTLRNPNA
jgi:hypothetical protein